MISRVSRRITKQVSAVSESSVTVMTTPWMLAFGSGVVRVVDELRAESGSLVQRVRVRTAKAVTDFPEAWTASSNTRTANGIGAEDFALEPGHMWVQAGLACAAATGVAEGRSSLTACVRGAGSIVASQRFQIQPFLNSSEAAYYPIGLPVPELGVTELLIAYVVTGVSGTLTMLPAGRSMDRLDEPSSWFDMASAVNITSNTSNAFPVRVWISH